MHCQEAGVPTRLFIDQENALHGNGCEWPVTHLFYLLGIGTECVETDFF